MKLIISQPALAALLAKGGSVANKSASVPILKNVRLVASEGLLSIASTDLDRFAESEHVADVSIPGEVTTNAAMFSALVGRHPRDKDISLELDGNILIVKCGRSRVQLPTLPVEDFPDWADMPATTFEMPAATLADALIRTRPACDAVTAGIMGGVSMKPEGGNLVFAATNRHHVVIITAPGSEVMDGPPLPGVIIPAEAIDVLTRILKGGGEATVSVNSSRIEVACDGSRLASKLIGGEYVDYNRIIPERGKPALVLSKSDLAESMGRAALTTEEGAYSALILIPRGEDTEIKSMVPNGGETRETFGVAAEPGFEAIGFNHAYVSNLLNAIKGDDVRFEFGGGSVCLVTSEGDDTFVGAIATVAINPTMIA